MKAIIGVPINSKSAYILEKFIENQKEIHKASKIECKTVFATEEKEFAKELRKKVGNGFEVIEFEVHKPLNAKDRMWNIVSARNAIREYFLKSDADFLIFIDADMTFEPEVINKLLEFAKDYDVVYNGYLDKGGVGIQLTGFGPTLIKRWVMEKVKFRCKERNRRTIIDCVYFEFDLFKVRAKIYRGFIAYSEHYDPSGGVAICHPRDLTFFERITNSSTLRFFVNIISIVLCYDILSKLKKFKLQLSMKMKN